MPSVGPFSFTVFSSGGTGNVAWTDPGNAAASDDAQATAAITVGQTTKELHCRQSNAAVPANATIDGITVDVERSASGAGVIDDQEVKLVNAADALIGSDLKLAGFWPTTDTYKTYGGAANLWGTTQTPETIRTLGVSVRAKIGFAAQTARVDHARITFTYTAPSPIFFSGPLALYSSTPKYYGM